MTIVESHIKKNMAEETNIKKLLNGIHVYRAHDQTEQLAIINSLSSFLSTNPTVQLLVIDSIAFHFRQDLQDTRYKIIFF
jgi:RAD51-like protein 2